jgi:urease accessory protein
MGATATRITAADFVTPSEFQRWRLAANPAGRIGGVRLELVADPGGTHLAGCYQQVPLRALPPFRNGSEEPSLLYLLNPTAGLMDGDGQLVEIRAGCGSRAVVAGQSATRIHPCLNGFSTQQWHLSVEAGAVLVVLPGPAIPFRDCRYYQRVVIDLAAGAHAVWGDIWLAGRYARADASEAFQFACLIQDLEVRRAGERVFRERFCWRGPWERDTAAWHFGHAPACGSVFASGLIPAGELLDGACFTTAAGDTCLRWLGSSEAVTASVVTAALRAAAQLSGGTAARPWLLTGHQLAPSHWFSVAGGSGD